MKKLMAGFVASVMSAAATSHEGDHSGESLGGLVHHSLFDADHLLMLAGAGTGKTAALTWRARFSSLAVALRCLYAARKRLKKLIKKPTDYSLCLLLFFVFNS